MIPRPLKRFIGGGLIGLGWGGPLGYMAYLQLPPGNRIIIPVLIGVLSLILIGGISTLPILIKK